MRSLPAFQTLGIAFTASGTPIIEKFRYSTASSSPAASLSPRRAASAISHKPETQQLIRVFPHLGYQKSPEIQEDRPGPEEDPFVMPAW